jgi:hypothetical protein
VQLVADEREECQDGAAAVIVRERTIQATAVLWNRYDLLRFRFITIQKKTGTYRFKLLYIKI